MNFLKLLIKHSTLIHRNKHTRHRHQEPYKGQTQASHSVATAMYRQGRKRCTDEV
jgi:hypothetical protein